MSDRIISASTNPFLHHLTGRDGDVP